MRKKRHIKAEHHKRRTLLSKYRINFRVILIILIIVTGLVIANIYVSQPQLLSSRAKDIATLQNKPTPTPTTHIIVSGFNYLPKPPYKKKPANCIKTGCRQPENGCFVSCRSGIFGCQEYLKGEISTTYGHGYDKYRCQDYWILPSPIPTRIPIPTPTTRRIPTPTPNAYQNTETKYSNWFKEMFGLPVTARSGKLWREMIAQGAVLDLTLERANDLHQVLDHDINNKDIADYVFSVKNDKTIDGMYIAKFPPGESNPNFLIFSDLYYRSSKPMRPTNVWERWYYDNALYAWKFDGYGYPPTHAWPRIFGVDKKKNYVFLAPDLEDWELRQLGQGYPVDGEKLDIYRYNPEVSGNKDNKDNGQITKVVQIVKFNEHDNKIFLQMGSSSSQVILFEIYKDSNGDINFRGIYLSEGF